jgi:hypothetical protein
MKHFPPMIARVAIEPSGRRRWSFCIPLFLIWPLVGLLALLALPLLFIYALFVDNGIRKAGVFTAQSYALVCSLHGLRVNVDDATNKISVSV